MKLTIHPMVFLVGAVLLCVTWLALRTAPPAPPAPQLNAFGTRPGAVRPQRQTIEIDEQTLRRYAGTYRTDDGTTVTVALDGAHLFAQATGTPRFELLATSATEFFLADLDAEVAFEAGATGPARGFLVRFTTGEMTAKRAL